MTHHHSEETSWLIDLDPNPIGWLHSPDALRRVSSLENLSAVGSPGEKTCCLEKADSIPQPSVLSKSLPHPASSSFPCFLSLQVLPLASSVRSLFSLLFLRTSILFAFAALMDPLMTIIDIVEERDVVLSNPVDAPENASAMTLST
ncbi:hypothetical protein AMTRI_Chr13g117290 [Amborella trichopoda]